MTVMIEVFKTIWRARSFIISSVRGNLRAQITRSQLGYSWLILQPLAQALMFGLVLSGIMEARIEGIEGTFGFALYLLAGLLCWNLFSEIVSRSLNMFIEHANVMKKISFPRIAIPFIVAGQALVNNLLLFIAILVVYALFGVFPDAGYLWLPMAVAINLGFAMGIGILLGIVNVFVRDVGQVMQVVLQFWFWMTPIVYPVSILPASLKTVVEFNPMYHLVTWYHSILVFKNFSPPFALLWVVLLTGLLVAAAMLLFRRSNAELVDVL